MNDNEFQRADFMFAAGQALDLAPDTRQRYGVDAQRMKCLEELDELASVLSDENIIAMCKPATYDDALIDECADVFIMSISCASTIGAPNWVEQLAARIVFKVARTRDRMRSE